MAKGYGAITYPDTRPSKEARAIGAILAEEPPWGYKDYPRSSEYDWSHIAEGVLRAQRRLRSKDNPFMKERN